MCMLIADWSLLVDVVYASSMDWYACGSLSKEGMHYDTGGVVVLQVTRLL